jgi:hypothetical protein
VAIVIPATRLCRDRGWEWRRLSAPDHRDARRLADLAALGVPGDIRGQEPFQRYQVSGLRGSDKRRDESPLIAGADPSATATGDMSAGTGHELPGIRLGEREQVRDLSVWVIEPFPEHVRRSLRGRQSFHED